MFIQSEVFYEVCPSFLSYLYSALHPLDWLNVERFKMMLSVSLIDLLLFVRATVGCIEHNPEQLK